MSLSTVVVFVALGLDVLVGELPTRLHPVAWFGRVVALADREWARPRLAGWTGAIVLPVLGAVVLGWLVWASVLFDPLVGVVVAGLVLFVTTSFRALLWTVVHVSRLAEESLPEAREALAALAGRDATSLAPDGVRSAAVESLAENLADGLVAPLLAFGLGAALADVAGLRIELVLAFACAAAGWVKAVNTMDSMVGYPDRAFGTGAARLDDAVMWLPARATALLLAIWFADIGALRGAASWTPRVASPNAGWPMGTVAAALGVRLEKPDHYVLNPGGDPPTHADVRRALSRVGLAGLSAYVLAGVLAWS